MTDTSTGDRRRQDILRAATELLSDGGYQQLTIRAVAERCGVSVGLIYRYFTDKRAIFAAVLIDSQTEFIAAAEALPTDIGLVETLRRLIPVTTAQWALVGRLAGTWYDPENAGAAGAPFEQLRDSSRREFAALHAALERGAAHDGVAVVDAPDLDSFLWSSLMGLAEVLTVGWAPEPDRYIDFAAHRLARAITEPRSIDD